MPDDELLRAAERGNLSQPDVLRSQVRRMLADPKAHALVEICRLDDEHCEGSRIFQVVFEDINRRVALLVSQGFDGFDFLEKNQLLRGEHGKGLGLANGGVYFAAVGGKTGDGPSAGGFGDEAIDELGAAGVTEIGFFSEQKNRGDGPSLFEAREEFAGENLRHQ